MRIRLGLQQQCRVLSNLIIADRPSMQSVQTLMLVLGNVRRYAIYREGTVLDAVRITTNDGSKVAASRKVNSFSPLLRYS